MKLHAREIEKEKQSKNENENNEAVQNALFSFF